MWTVNLNCHQSNCVYKPCSNMISHQCGCKHGRSIICKFLPLHHLFIPIWECRSLQSVYSHSSLTREYQVRIPVPSLLRPIIRGSAYMHWMPLEYKYWTDADWLMCYTMFHVIDEYPNLILLFLLILFIIMLILVEQ